MFSIMGNYGGLFLDAFWMTLKLFIIAGIGALIWGTILGAFRVSPVPALRAFGTAYVNVVRNTPLTLVFAFLVFAAPKMNLEFPAILGQTSYFWAACAALTLYTSAFICEVVRSGINTVDVGQAEAARAIGMTFTQVLTLIVLPQAFRTIMPPLFSTLIAMLKNTTVAAGFSVAEAGALPAIMSEKGENQMIVLFWITVGFLILITPLVILQRWAERKLAVTER